MWRGNQKAGDKLPLDQSLLFLGNLQRTTIDHASTRAPALFSTVPPRSLSRLSLHHMTTTLLVGSTPDALAAELTRRISSIARESVQARGVFNVAVSGGSMPKVKLKGVKDAVVTCRHDQWRCQCQHSAAHGTRRGRFTLADT